MTDSEYGGPVLLTLGWVSQGDSGDERGVCLTVTDAEDGQRVGRLWFSRGAMAELLASKADQPGRWQVPKPAPTGMRIFGRWCPKCEAMVPASHKRDMLQIPIREVGHEWFPLFSRADG